MTKAAGFFEDSRTGRIAYLDLFRASPMQRVQAIRAGVLAANVEQLRRDLRLDPKTMCAALNLEAATVNRKISRGEHLSLQNSERVIGLARLVGQLEEMLDNIDGADQFAAEWMSSWLLEPLPALGGGPPIEFLDTMEGQALVSQALAQIQSGAYA